MAKETKKTVRITDEMKSYIENLAKRLNLSENDVFKMIIFNQMEQKK